MKKLLLTLFFCIIPTVCFGGVDFGTGYSTDEAYIDVPNDFGFFDGGSDFTIGAWVRFNTLTDGGGGTQYIFHPRGEYDILLRADTGDARIEFTFFDGSLKGVTTSNSYVSAGQDYCVVGTWDADGNMELIINNSSIGTLTTGNPSAVAGDSWIGNASNADDNKIQGVVWDFALWSKVLTTNEIEVYCSGVKRSALQISSLSAYWPLDDIGDGINADGSTLKDISGNGKNATANKNTSGTISGEAESVLSYP